MNKKKKNTEGRIAFPASVLWPVGEFLRGRLALLQKRKKGIEKEDPFKDTDRIIDNASPDTEAAEQFGHARTSAIRQQLLKNIIQTRKAITMLRIGRYGICEDCGKMIDTDRLMVYPETTLCAQDAAKREGK
ncbi:MAG: DnaK suppressor protein [Candidatus Curtissbacteria bacterium GW2011_GWC1_44_33]|uniref:DnaK suppressor protein n=1 Tax=Candidatus Curtissbacteria bacterium GW2011_GWC1_44_33 TaxID=1618413 RepID=A0A0G1J6E6_9BACT|nr:MAG: DnaK suppressor protein [Candidatus Curtissbacteria bacterium GW2011_GWC1_44_33]